MNRHRRGINIADHPPHKTAFFVKGMQGNFQ